ncbi:MAG: DUF4339 domain-containing protein [Akkermansia sp.]|nr:DUF4339 domain-containing protein [Akkermansia sp.]
MARKFYYDADGEKLGPVSGQELLYLRAEGRINDATWVRAEDSQTWRPFSSVNLNEERRKEAEAGPWRRMLSSASPRTLLLLGLILLSLLVFVAVIFIYAWPLILCGLAFLMVMGLMKMK